MTEHETFVLDLEENALNSLIHGIDHFLDNKIPYSDKYAVMHIFQAVELFLKARLAQEHEMLIYLQPEDSKYGSQTVSFEKLVKRLKAAGVQIEADVYSDLDNLRKFRNHLQHHKIHESKQEIQHRIGRGIRFLEDFVKNELDVSLEEVLEEKTYQALSEIIRSFEELLDKAEEEMALHFSKDSEFQTSSCPECGNETILFPDPTLENNSSVHCFFCKEVFSVDNCPRCGELVYDDSDAILCSNCWQDIANE